MIAWLSSSSASRFSAVEFPTKVTSPPSAATPPRTATAPSRPGAVRLVVHGTQLVRTECALGIDIAEQPVTTIDRSRDIAFMSPSWRRRA